MRYHQAETEKEPSKDVLPVAFSKPEIQQLLQYGLVNEPEAVEDLLHRIPNGNENHPGSGLTVIEKVDNSGILSISIYNNLTSDDANLLHTAKAYSSTIRDRSVVEVESSQTLQKAKHKRTLGVLAVTGVNTALAFGATGITYALLHQFTPGAAAGAMTSYMFAEGGKTLRKAFSNVRTSRDKYEAAKSDATSQGFKEFIDHANHLLGTKLNSPLVTIEDCAFGVDLHDFEENIKKEGGPEHENYEPELRQLKQQHGEIWGLKVVDEIKRILRSCDVPLDSQALRIYGNSITEMLKARRGNKIQLSTLRKTDLNNTMVDVIGSYETNILNSENITALKILDIMREVRLATERQYYSELNKVPDPFNDLTPPDLADDLRAYLPYQATQKDS